MSNSSKQSLASLVKSSVEQKFLLMLFVTAIIPIGILGTSLFTGLFTFYASIAAIICQLAGLTIGFVLSSKLVRQTASINETLLNIANGNLEARADKITTDELGIAAESLNAMCDTTLNLTQSNEERDEIQASIENLVSEVKQIAAGDLTINTEVQKNVTGSLADSVNHMTKQLRSIVKQVKTAAEQVNASSSQICQASTSMSLESDTHASRIGDASGQLLQMTDSFQQVAKLTQDSVDVAVEARHSASKGLKAVSDTVDGMQRIRNQVQNTSKRIKRLGESSQEIGEIVQLISDITDRTSILALNASIQASMAGDAGQGFAVVAEEIERLADRSTDATKQISKLIRSIQNETTEVISDMEESTREVVAGSQLAAQAGETLSEIDSVSTHLVDLIQSSSSSALQQAQTATVIASSMTEISTSTKQSAEKSREATRVVALLANTVNELRESVSKFKVSQSEGLSKNAPMNEDIASRISQIAAPAADIPPPQLTVSPLSTPSKPALKKTPTVPVAPANPLQGLASAAPTPAPAMTPIQQQLLTPKRKPTATVATPSQHTPTNSLSNREDQTDSQTVEQLIKSLRESSPTNVTQDKPFVPPIIAPNASDKSRPKTVATPTVSSTMMIGNQDVTVIPTESAPISDEQLLRDLREAQEHFKQMQPGAEAVAKPKKKCAPVTLPTPSADDVRS